MMFTEFCLIDVLNFIGYVNHIRQMNDVSKVYAQCHHVGHACAETGVLVQLGGATR